MSLSKVSQHGLFLIMPAFISLLTSILIYAYGVSIFFFIIADPVALKANKRDFFWLSFVAHHDIIVPCGTLSPDVKVDMTMKGRGQVATT